MAEAAGLVLGAFPLLIAGIRAREKIMSLRQYRSNLSKYRDELMMEEVILQNTWFAIVRLGQYSIVQQFPGLSLEELRKNPRKAMATYNIPLMAILGLALPNNEKQHLEVIVRTFQKLSELVATLAETLDVTIDSQENSEGQPEVEENTYIEKLKNLTIMVQTELKTKSRNENLESIRRQNSKLWHLVSGQAIMQTYTAVHSSPPRPIKNNTNKNSSLNPTMVGAATSLYVYNTIQRQAKALHSVLEQGFQSSALPCCQLGHGGFLQLKVPLAPLTEKDIHHEDTIGPVGNGYRFGLTLCISFEGSTMQNAQEEGHSACELELEINIDEHEDHGTAHAKTPGPSIPASLQVPSDRTRVGDRNIANITGIQAHENPNIPQTGAGERTAQLAHEGAPGLQKPRSRSLKRNLSDFSGSSIAQAYKRLRRPGSADARQPSARTCSPDRMRDVELVNLRMEDGATGSNGHIPQIVFPEPDNFQISTPQPHPISVTTKQSLWICQICINTNYETIDVLCLAATVATQEEERQSCVGILSKTAGKDKVRVCPRNGKPLKVESMEVVSLHHIFSIHKMPSVFKRFRLAVLLASSVMQLHETSWLNDLWCSRDIFFKRTNRGSTSVRFDEPYLKSSFHRAQASIENAGAQVDEWEDCMGDCNRALFKLGIMLIEIHYWEPFESISLVQGRQRSEVIKESIIPELSENMGRNYGCAVGLCVGGLGCEAIVLGHEGFKKAVYDGIVAPLEEDLKKFF